MEKEATEHSGPDWDRLYETAASQDGYFTTSQASEAGYYPQLLQKYLRNGSVVRERRAVYRLVHFPPGEHEDLVVVWLWSGHQGVFSHETALSLHGLSDALPSRTHLTVPESWRMRRVRVPEGVVLHYAPVGDEERTWSGPVPVTTPDRTILDAAADRVPPDLVRQAIDEGLRRGLFNRDAVEEAIAYVRTFGSEG
ncbi:MAG: type IV toxin-antitoxin system AbiEi family antitoxin domain-containing protein [Myxococcota bacterium]